MSNLSNVSLSLSGIPCEVVARNVVLFNCNLSTIISFARTGKDYYKEITEYVDNLWSRRVESPSSQSSQMTFFEFIGGCRRLFIDFKRINQLSKGKKNKEKYPERSLIFENLIMQSLVRNLTYQRDEKKGLFLDYNFSAALELDLKRTKNMEAEISAKIADKQFERKANLAFITWIFMMIGLVAFIAYYIDISNIDMEIWAQAMSLYSQYSYYSDAL